MHPILFYGVPEGCSFGSIIALEWLGEPYQLCRIAMPEVVSSADFKRINPMGETPALVTASGEIISESMAILNHIGARAIGSGLAFAQGTPEYDRLNQMLAFLNTSYFNAFVPLWYALEHAKNGSAGETLREYGRTLVKKAHANLETLLQGREWLVGESRTLADAYFMGIARWADFHQVIDRRDYPRIHRLYERLLEDPAVGFAQAIEHEKPVSGSRALMGHVDLHDVLGKMFR